MKLVFALGNIGAQYDGTRHNAGFAMLDACADTYGIAGEWQTKDKFKALVAEVNLNGEKVMLAKPTTYYNLAGESARAIMDFYKLGLDDILVLHDDLDLGIGTIRTRVGGSDGGSNGLKSLHTHIGRDFARIRIGVAGEHRHNHDAVDYVLGRFTSDEQTLLQKQSQTVIALITDFAGGTFTVTTSKP